MAARSFPVALTRSGLMDESFFKKCHQFLQLFAIPMVDRVLVGIVKPNNFSERL
jgi:hypothetical protein